MLHAEWRFQHVTLKICECVFSVQHQKAGGGSGNKVTLNSVVTGVELEKPFWLTVGTWHLTPLYSFGPLEPCTIVIYLARDVLICKQKF